MRNIRTITIVGLGLLTALARAQEGPTPVRTELTTVASKRLDKASVIPGELRAFQRVDMHAMVTGFVEQVRVDRGAHVKKGQLLAVMTAPELAAQRAEAQARLAAVEAQRVEAQATLAGAESTYARMKEAAQTPGVVAGNDVVLAEKSVEAEQARIVSLERTIKALEAAVLAVEETERYLRVVAPFDGVVTERNVHVGTLAGRAGGVPLFTIEQIHRLRLVAAVPEAYTASIEPGRAVSFSVPAHPGRTFTGSVARPAYAVDPATRTMPVELDVDNADGALAPGMYAEVSWPIRRAANSLFVPGTAIKATTERIFVIRVRAGAAEWVDVRRGMTQENLVEIFGDLTDGDQIVLRATDEIRPGTRVEAR